MSWVAFGAVSAMCAACTTQAEAPSVANSATPVTSLTLTASATLVARSASSGLPQGNISTTHTAGPAVPDASSTDSVAASTASSGASPSGAGTATATSSTALAADTTASGAAPGAPLPDAAATGTVEPMSSADAGGGEALLDAGADSGGLVTDPFTVGLWRVVARSDRMTLTRDPNTGQLLAAAYSGNRKQQWRFLRQASGSYAIKLESNAQCLLAQGEHLGLADCNDQDSGFARYVLRSGTEQRPAVYHLRTSENTCVTPNGAAAPTLGPCNDAARIYIEPVGYGERSQPVEYEVRSLLLVKPVTDIAGETYAEITPDIVEAAKVSYIEHVATWFERMTDGRVVWTAEAVVSPDRLTSLTQEGGNWLPFASDLQSDVVRSVPRGKYDTVTVFFTGGALEDGWGYGPGSSVASNYTLWATVAGGFTPAAEWIAWSNEPTEVFVHEPMHGFDSFFDPLGLPLPDGYLHGTELNNYSREEDGWMPWYRDYWLGTVIAADDTYRGFGPRMFRMGAPREHALTQP